MVPYIKRLIRFDAPGNKEWVVYFFCFFLLHVPALYNYYQQDYDNAYLLFAESLSKGMLDMPKMDYYGDMSLFNGRYYLPHPPLPAFLLLPFVLIFGAANTNVVLVAFLISFLNLRLVYNIFTKLNVNGSQLSWCICAFFFASPYWYAFFVTHSLYAYAHITSLMFLLLFINEYFGKRRWWLIGFFIGCSMLCRQFTLFAIVVPLITIICDRKEYFFKHLFALLVPFGFMACLYLLFNYLRFNDPLDTGYGYILYQGEMKDRVDAHGVFSYKYFLFNLYSYFLKGFNIVLTGKDTLELVDMDRWGTSLLSASPFVVYSLRRGLDRKTYWSFALAVLIILFGILFYHNNGFVQVNTMRFSLDFFPMLMVLVVTGVQKNDYWMFRGMIIYSILLNIVAFTIHFMAE